MVAVVVPAEFDVVIEMIEANAQVENIRYTLCSLFLYKNMNIMLFMVQSDNIDIYILPGLWILTGVYLLIT